MLLSDGVPAHVDALYGAKRDESILDGVLAQLKTNASNVNAAHQHQGLMTLEGLRLLQKIETG